MADMEQDAEQVPDDQQDDLTPSERELTDQAEQPDAVRKAIATERRERKAAEKALKELNTRLREFEDKDRTEGERLQARADEAEKALAEATAKAKDLELQMLRARVAAQAGLPAEAVSRLQGSTEAELKRDAEQLSALVGARTRAASAPSAGFGGGPRGSEAPADSTQAQGQRILDALTRQ